MECQSSVTSVRRRSDRVSIAFPIEFTGMDLSGSRFSEKTHTTAVSRYGCCLTLHRLLRADQPIFLRREGIDEAAVGRVVAPMGERVEGHLYGIGTSNSCESLWGIRFSSSFYDKLLDHVHDGVYLVNRERRINYWNESAERLTGYSAAEVIGKHCFDNLLQHVDEAGNSLCLSACPLSQVMRDGQPRMSRYYLHHKEGHRIPILVRAIPTRNNEGRIVGAAETFSDATIATEVDSPVKALEQSAFRDPLTGLANRRHVELKLEQALQEHARLQRLYGLLLLEMDHFESVNDTHGQQVGDTMLKTVAQTLVHVLRGVDIIGRWGGEEFLVLAPDVDALALGDLAERCRVLIAKSSVSVGDTDVSVTASIGATMLEQKDSVPSVLRRADELMCRSKHSGGDRTTAG